MGKTIAKERIVMDQTGIYTGTSRTRNSIMATRILKAAQAESAPVPQDSSEADLSGKGSASRRLSPRDLGKLLTPADALHFEETNAADMLWSCKLPGLMNSSIAVSPEGTVFVGCDDHKLYAIKEGRKSWEYDTGTWVRAPIRIGDDGIVYVGGSKTMHAVRDGKKEWDFTLEPRYMDGCDRDFSGSIEHIIAGPGGTVYIGEDNGDVYAIRDGKRLWKHNTDGSCDYAKAPDPVPGKDGLVYSGSYRGTLYAFKDGEIQWQAKHCGDNLLAGEGGVIYSTGGWPENLFAIKEGAELWKCPLKGSLLAPPVQGPDGTLYCAANADSGEKGGTIYAIKDGKILWHVKNDERFESSPCLAQDGTLLASSGKRIIAVKDGLAMWAFSSDDKYFRAAPVQGADGTFYAASHDGTVFAFRDPFTEASLDSRIEEALQSGEEAKIVEVDDEWLFVDGVRLPVSR